MPSSLKQLLRVGTRESALARWQTDMALAELNALNAGIEFDIVPIKTSGDKVLNKPLAEIGGRGVFVKELEEALFAKEVDFVVHSLKDLPTEMPEGLVLGATLNREDPRDVLVCNAGTSFEQLPAGSRVATSSRRRSAQLCALRQDLCFVDIRGNIATRLRKHDEGVCDAMVLAAAGLLRLGQNARICHYFDAETCTPAPGQGALAIECRLDAPVIRELLHRIHDERVGATTTAERAFLSKLGGGCSVPVGALAILQSNGTMELSGCIASLDGKQVFRRRLSAPSVRAEQLGFNLADEMISAGAGEVLSCLVLSPPNAISPP